MLGQIEPGMRRAECLLQVELAMGMAASIGPAAARLQVSHAIARSLLAAFGMFKQ